MNTSEVIGTVAAVLMTLSFIPQVCKSINTTGESDVSTVMYLLFLSSVVLWLIYGKITEQIVLIYSNSIMIALVLIILMCITGNGKVSHLIQTSVKRIVAHTICKVNTLMIECIAKVKYIVESIVIAVARCVQSGNIVQ